MANKKQKNNPKFTVHANPFCSPARYSKRDVAKKEASDDHNTFVVAAVVATQLLAPNSVGF